MMKKEGIEEGHQESTGPFEPPGGDSIQDQSGATLTDFTLPGFDESGNMTPESAYGELSPHAGMTAAAACDRKIDQEKMAEKNSIGSINHLEELNRLAMLSEKEVPFDLIFGGSPGDGSKRLQSVYVTPVPFGENITPEAPSAHGSDNNNQLESGGNQFESSNNENVDPVVKHPCPIEVVVNFNHKNASANDESDSEVNSLDPIAPGGYDPFKPSGCKDKTMDFEPEDKGGGPLECSPLIMAMYNSGMFYNKCKMPEDVIQYHKRTKEKSDEKFVKATPFGGDFQKQCIDTQAEVFSDETEFGLPSSGDQSIKSVTSEPSGDKMDEDKSKESFENENIISLPSMSPETISGLEPTFAVKLEQLINKCGQDKILDVLTNQLHTLDEEIKLYENALSTSPAPPPEELHEKQSPSDKPEVDLSVWLMPSAK